MMLESLGWNAFFSDAFERYNSDGMIPGRIAQEHRNGYLIITGQGDLRAEISGALRHRTADKSQFPAVGDWVALRVTDEGTSGIIHGVLPRRSVFSRKIAGEATEEQVVAANVDTLFIVAGLDGNFNPRRIERTLIMAWESGASPVVVLNKCDLAESPDERIEETRLVAPGVPVLAVSAAADIGMEQLLSYAGPGRTVALIGSSGVGKSSITNRLIGEEVQKVEHVSESVGKGRHTTTRRDLIRLPSGGAIIDTPGMREMQLWGSEEGIQETFDDVEGFAAECHFRDCTHHDEPGCAVTAALADGRLDENRFRNYRKMERELRHLAIRQDERAQRKERENWKRITMEIRRGRLRDKRQR